jgi:hypothetical protein
MELRTLYEYIQRHFTVPFFFSERWHLFLKMSETRTIYQHELRMYCCMCACRSHYRATQQNTKFHKRKIFIILRHFRSSPPPPAPPKKSRWNMELLQFCRLNTWNSLTWDLKLLQFWSQLSETITTAIGMWLKGCKMHFNAPFSRS